MFPKMKIEQLKLGPTGCLLLQNLKNEWFYNIIINKDTSVFPSGNNDFRETFQYAKSVCLEKLPFGVAEMVQNRKPSNESELIEYYNERMNNQDVDFKKLFGNEDNTTLKCTIFASSSESVPFFHQWQRQRRIWWRKVYII